MDRDRIKHTDRAIPWHGGDGSTSSACRGQPSPGKHCGGRSHQGAGIGMGQWTSSPCCIGIGIG